MAAYTQKEAAQALGISLRTLRGWWAVTGNPMEIDTATRSPGTVFVKPEYWPPDSDFVPLPTDIQLTKH